MVQFPGFHFVRLCVQRTITGHDSGWVTPFGNLRIVRCVLLPAAFRSLPRPSSSDSSRASTVNSYSLDHISPTSLAQSGYSIAQFSTRFVVTRLSFPCVCQRTSNRLRDSLTPPRFTRERPHGLFNYDAVRRLSTGGVDSVEVRGFEPLTYGLQSHRSSQLSYTPGCVGMT